MVERRRGRMGKGRITTCAGSDSRSGKRESTSNERDVPFDSRPRSARRRGWREPPFGGGNIPGRSLNRRTCKIRSSVLITAPWKVGSPIKPSLNVPIEMPTITVSPLGKSTVASAHANAVLAGPAGRAGATFGQLPDDTRILPDETTEPGAEGAVRQFRVQIGSGDPLRGGYCPLLERL